MTKERIIFFAALALTVFIVVGVWSARTLLQPPQALIAVQGGDPPPQGGCSQCLGKQCYSAPCNMDCRPVGDGCETVVAGGAQQDYTPETKKNGGDYAEFFMQRVVKNNAAMEAAGIEIGDVITKVNGSYAGSDLEFAKLVLRLPRSTELTVWKSSGAKLNVTL